MKTLAWIILAVSVFALSPAAAEDADDTVTVPNLVGMKGGNDIIAILTSLKLHWKFGDRILAPSREKELTVASQVPPAGMKVPEDSTVLVTAYSHYAPMVVGLPLEKATAKLEAEGVPLAGIDVSNAPSPEHVNEVVYQGIPDEAGRVTLHVYAPYYQGSEPQTSTATPAPPPSGGGTPPSAGAGGTGRMAVCGSPGGGIMITTKADTPCSLNFAAAVGVPASLFSDMRLEGQPSHGTASWSNATLTYTPAPGYRGRDSITFSATAKTAVNGQIVNLGRQNTAYGILVQ